MKPLVAATLATVLLLLASRSEAEHRWVADASGRCASAWTATSLEHGPIAIGSGATLPVRSAAGGGVFEAVEVIILGVFDTLTGGVLELTPEELTHLDQPLVVQLPESRRTIPAADVRGRCAP